MDIKHVSAGISKLVPKLQIPVKNKPIRFPRREGPIATLKFLGESVTALFKFERIEMHRHKAVEVRGYAERLIVEAIRHGDTHQRTMEFVDFYIHDKQVIHKLFKVLVPRYQEFTSSFTSIYEIPVPYALIRDEKLNKNPRYLNYRRAVLELKGHPYPPMPSTFGPSRSTYLNNVLLRGALKEYNWKNMSPDK